MRVAFHAINGIGLGHLVRVTTIAAEVRTLFPDAAILILTSAADTSLVTALGFDFVSLPPRLGEPHADPERVRRALPGPLEFAAISAALTAFEPDLVVFDTHAPLPVVRHVATIGARAVLVQREVRKEELAAFVLSKASLLFDRIVVPHEPGEVDLGAALHLPFEVTGHVMRALDTRLPRGVRAPRVLMMAGGGGQPVDGRRFLRAAADAHILSREKIEGLSTWLVTGPYGGRGLDLDGIKGLTVVGSCSFLPALLARAEVVVSQAGYNSVAEIRSLEKPAILVPGRRKAEDQKARAMRLVKAGAAMLARPEARSIASKLEALLLSPALREKMVAAHKENPLVARNRETALAVLRPIRTSRTVKRVVLVAHEFPPRVGGMETVARALVHGLLAAGVAVHVYTVRRFDEEGGAFPEGVVRRIYRHGIDLWGDLLITMDALQSDAPDVIHLCNAGLAPWVPALWAAFPALVTVTVHGNDLLSPWVHHGGDPSTYREALTRGLCRADAVFAVSSFSFRAAMAEVEGQGSARAKEANIEVVENGVDCVRFAPGSPDVSLAAKFGIASSDEVVLTVSRLVPRKGHVTMLRAMVELLRERPNALFVYTGEHPRLGAELDTLAAELGVRHRVRGVGKVEEDDLPGLYRLAHVFALLSDASATDVEGFGIALLEAAASGLPTVGAASGGIPEAIVDGVTGLLVPPGDPGEAARAIAQLLADDTARRTLGEHGRSRTLAHYSTHARTAQLLARWNERIAGPRRPRDLEGFRESFEGGTSPTATARTASQRALLRAAPSGVALVRLAQADANERRLATARRRETFANIVKSRRTVRLRSLDGGVALLAESLADCVAIGHEPLVEMRLRRFLDPDFLAYAVPRIRGALLTHVVPFEGAAALERAVELLPLRTVAKIGSLRLFLAAEVPEEKLPEVVEEARRLRALLGTRGVEVEPPKELAHHFVESVGGPSEVSP